MHPERKKMFIISVIILFSFFMVMGIGNFRAEQLAVDLAGEMVTRAVAVAADNLDKQELQEIIKTLDQQHPYYTQMQNQLTKIKEEHGLEDLYIIYKDQQEVNWVHIIDVRASDDVKHKNLGEKLKSGSVGAEKAIRGKVAEGLYQGSYISSYLGLKNSEGDIFAVLVGDYNAEDMTDFLYLTRYVQFGIIAVATVFLVLILLYFKKKSRT